MDIPETGVMRVLYNQHGAALWHYACRLTSNATGVFPLNESNQF